MQKLKNKKIYLSLIICILTLIFFLPRNTKVNKEVVKTEVKKTKIIFAGDVMLGRTVMTTTLDSGDINYPFLKIKEKLKTADLVFVNLENPIIENCPRHYDGFKFCATPEQIQGLKNSNIKLVTLANNHTYNYGKSGFEETKSFLTKYGLNYVGDSNLHIEKINETSFGFLGFDFLTNKPTDKDFELIKSSDEKVDVLVLGVHWGVEYKSEPENYQRQWAQKLVDAGADLIIGHHPHWVQSSELIDEVPVFYSLGNIIFDQMWSEETKRGMLVEIEFEAKNIVRTTKYYTYISSWAQPEIVK